MGERGEAVTGGGSREKGGFGFGVAVRVSPSFFFG